MKTRTPLFPLGQIVATPGAIAALQSNGQSPAEFLDRHLHGDWGDLDEFDKRANHQALKDGERLLSAYSLADNTKIWLITEADRSSTCILLPSEY